MAAFVDLSQIQQVTVSDPDGVSVEVIIVPLVVPLDEVPALLAEYEPENSRHPLAALARPLARPVLDAMKLAVEANNG